MTETTSYGADARDHLLLEQLVERLDPVMEMLNSIADDADYKARTWEAIQKLREACTWLSVERIINNEH